MDRTIDQLERDLRGADSPGVPGRPDLPVVRRRGARRRRARLAGGAGAAVLASGVTAALLVAGSGADRAVDSPIAVRPRPAPPELSALARRALAEIPGAAQVTAGQVVIPGPGDGRDAAQRVPDDVIDRGPVDIGAHNYADVSWFDSADVPTWLYDGVQALPARASGVLVDGGALELACMRPLPEWGGSSDDDDDGCSPAMLGGSSGQWTYEWGMGADGFLDEGEPLQVFTAESADPRSTVWIGGVDGTDVASVDLVATDGTVVSATVASGTVVPDDTMFWGTVRGDLAEVVSRDANGGVLERHEIRSCTGGVDCEVR